MVKLYKALQKTKILIIAKTNHLIRDRQRRKQPKTLEIHLKNKNDSKISTHGERGVSSEFWSGVMVLETSWVS